MPRLERECNAPVSPQHLLPMQWAPCAQRWKWGTLQPIWRLSVSEVRNQTARSHFQQYQTATPSGASCSAKWAKTCKTAPKTECWDSGPHPHRVWTLRETCPSLHNTWTAPCPSKSCPSCRWGTHHTVRSTYAKNYSGTKRKMPNHK